MQKEDFWRRRLNRISAENGPFLVKGGSVYEDTIIVKPSTERSDIYKRRILGVYWVPKDMQNPGDREHVQIYAGNIRTRVVEHSEVWELKLYNASADDAYVDVFAYQEELIGTVDLFMPFEKDPDI
ncbi:hypothetical protein D3C74_364870 [compost metagenome]